MARVPTGPQRDNVKDWLVWHFTHVENLPAICQSGRLLSPTQIRPTRSVANDEVKNRRTYVVEPDASYPRSTVKDHVPFYIAAKSPMLFAVTAPGHGSFKAKSSDLVFLGAAVGDLVDAGLTLCFSNSNAASSYTSFSRDMSRIGTFVDFDLLCQKMWRNTPDDPFRQGRRAAECLVLSEVPLGLVSVVMTRNEATLHETKSWFADDSTNRHYEATTAIFYN